jgi:hypothetical protein
VILLSVSVVSCILFSCSGGAELRLACLVRLCCALAWYMPLNGGAELLCWDDQRHPGALQYIFCLHCRCTFPLAHHRLPSACTVATTKRQSIASTVQQLGTVIFCTVFKPRDGTFNHSERTAVNTVLAEGHTPSTRQAHATPTTVCMVPKISSPLL